LARTIASRVRAGPPGDRFADQRAGLRPPFLQTRAHSSYPGVTDLDGAGLRVGQHDDRCRDRGEPGPHHAICATGRIRGDGHPSVKDLQHASPTAQRAYKQLAVHVNGRRNLARHPDRGGDVSGRHGRPAGLPRKARDAVAKPAMTCRQKASRETCAPEPASPE